MSELRAITPDIAAAFSLCKRKAFLQLRGDCGEPAHEYVQLIDSQAVKGMNIYLDYLQTSGLTLEHGSGDKTPVKDYVFSHVLLKADQLEATADVLLPVVPTSPNEKRCFEPHLVIGSHRVATEDKLRLAFISQVLSNTGHLASPTGVIVNVAGITQRIPLTKWTVAITRIIDALKNWSITPMSEPPPVLLNDHCQICPFRASCRQQAEKEDNLTLLDRMTPEIINRLNRKGIFTVNQLSYLFRPRRPRKRRTNQPAVFRIELQALALRTGKIYLHQTPSIPAHETELFLDIEGIPDRGSHYLVGLLVCAKERIERYSFWADSPDEERLIFKSMARIAKENPDAPIFHYGSYEPKALERIAKRFNLPFGSIMDRLINVNSFVFGKVYFPTRSNTLKDLGRYLGAAWTAPDASGLQSVVWRLQWEESKDSGLKERITTYNLEDCNALRILVMELRNIAQAASTRPDVDFIDKQKKFSTPSGQQIHGSLEGILKSAHEQYKKNRINIKEGMGGSESGQEGQQIHKKQQTFHRIAPTKVNKIVRVRRLLKCPQHKGQSLEKTDRMAEHTLMDLTFTKNGCKKTLTKLMGLFSHCPRCPRNRCDYVPPAIRRLRGRYFGHGFRAWIVYQRITLRLPYHIISQVSYDLFGEQVTISTLVSIISDLADYYSSTEKLILKKILTSPFIHVDETKINIQGANYYVWVLTDGQHVVFRLTETRESTLIQEILREYAGILISDFYGGYDSCQCRQQKCLVHLIRDLNDDLWQNPHNLELE